MSQIIRAAQFARSAHKGQMRKWGIDPYIFHPMRVAGRVTLLDDVTDEMICAAWLHDVCEDCGVAGHHLWEEFGTNIADLVTELTNPSKKLPTETPRAEKKNIDREHLKGVSADAKRIKLVDRWDNLCDLRDAPSDFVKLYVEETMLLLDAIGDADEYMETSVAYQCGIVCG